MSNPGPNVQTSANTTANMTNVSSPVLVTQSSLQMGIPSSGTITAAGALTMTTALDIIYGPTNNNIPGIWLYFPATAFATAPAGWYWCVMTSTTLGTVYAANYVPPLTASIGQSATPIVGSGSGYTQTVSSLRYAPIVAIPGNSMGPNGSLRVTSTQSNNNSAGGKSFGMFWSASSTMSSANTLQSLAVTTSTTGRFQAQMDNAGATNSQIWMQPAVAAFGTTSTPTQASSIDTTQTTYIGIGMNLAVATDWVICQSLLVEALPG